MKILKGLSDLLAPWGAVMVVYSIGFHWGVIALGAIYGASLLYVTGYAVAKESK